MEEREYKRQTKKEREQVRFHDSKTTMEKVIACPRFKDHQVRR